MSAPTPIVRRAVYERDNFRCVACDTTEDLTFQHRVATGMGGSKLRPGAVAGLTLCLRCNQACEADMQTVALRNGYKVRRWADPSRVPVYYPHLFGWFVLAGVKANRITGPIALDMMHAVYGDEYEKWDG